MRNRTKDYVLAYRRVDVPKSRKRDEESGRRQSGHAAAGVGTEASAASLAQCVSHLVRVGGQGGGEREVRVRVRARVRIRVGVGPGVRASERVEARAG